MLSGCFPGVYKIDVQQGNIITQDMVDQLRPGMSKTQVVYLLESPLLRDPFHANRWDYIYSIQPAGGTIYQENEALFFTQDGLLSGLTGDFLPGVSRDEAILGGQNQKGSIHSDDTNKTSNSIEQSIQGDVDNIKLEPIPVPDTINR